MDLLLFFLAAIGMLAILGGVIAHNSNYMLTLISNVCSVRRAYRVAGAAARAEAWENLNPKQKEAVAA